MGREALVFGFGILLRPPERLCTQGALHADRVGCTLSVKSEDQNGNSGFIVSDASRQSLSIWTFAQRRAKRYVAEGQVRLDHRILAGNWQGHRAEVGRMRREDWRPLL